MVKDETSKVDMLLKIYESLSETDRELALRYLENSVLNRTKENKMLRKEIGRRDTFPKEL